MNCNNIPMKRWHIDESIREELSLMGLIDRYFKKQYDLKLADEISFSILLFKFFIEQLLTLRL